MTSVTKDEQIRQDSAYLDEVFELMKLNYNCPQDEKTGEGKGSCGGKTGNDSDELPDIGKAMSDYQNYGYSAINDQLRGTNIVKQNPQQKANLDKIIKTIDSEMKKNPLTEKKLLYRADNGGISVDAFEATGLRDEFEKLFGKRNIKIDDLIEHPEIEKKLREKLIGFEYKEKAYLSTGKYKENVRDRFLAPSSSITPYGVEGMVDIIVPEGTNALRVSEYTGLEDELGGKIDEYLIDRDQTIVIDNVTVMPADGKRIYLQYRTHIKPSHIKPNQKQNSLLDDAYDFIKQNYKCEFNGTNFECPDKQEPAKEIKPAGTINPEYTRAENIVQHALNAERQKLVSEGSSPDNARIEMRVYDGNFLGSLINERPSNEYKALAKVYGIKDETSLNNAWDLIKDISKGDQDAARETIYSAFKSGGDLKKALELQIEVETQEFLNRTNNYKKRQIDDVNRRETDAIKDLQYSLETNESFQGPDGSYYAHRGDHWEKDMEPIKETTSDLRAKIEPEIRKAFDKEREIASKMQYKIYRKGNYHENTIESYTTNSKGVNMTWMTNPDEHIGVDFSLTADKIVKDGWKVLSGVNTNTGYIGEDEVVLINMKDLESEPKRTYDKDETLARIETSRIEKEGREIEYKTRTTSIYPNEIKNAGPKVPKIPSETKPLNKEQALNDISSFGKLPKTYYSDPVVDNLAKQTGFDKPPVIASAEQLNNLVDEGGIELLMHQKKTNSDNFKTAGYLPLSIDGYSFDFNLARKADNIKDAKDNPGKYLFSTGPDTAITRAVMSPNARIIDKDELKKQSDVIYKEWQDKGAAITDEKWKEFDKVLEQGLSKEERNNKKLELDAKYDEESKKYYDAARKLEGDLKVAAMVLGYDAIKDNNYIAVVNRSSVYVQKDDIPIDDIDKLQKYYSTKNMADSYKRWADEIKQYDEDPAKKEELIKSYLESSEETKKEAIKLRDEIYSVKHNELFEVADFMKQNYNCPDSEKTGSGKGSCGGGNETHKDLPNGYNLTITQSLKSEPGKVTLTWTAPDSPSRMTGSQFKIQFPNKEAIAITIRYPKSDTKAAPRLARVLASVPPKLAVNVKKFVLTDNPNRTDAIASKQYGKPFVTAASFNKVDQSISFFGRNGYTASISKDTLIHELTHSLDAKLGDISRTKEYKQAVEMDSKLGKKSEFTSNYARDSYKVKYNDPLEEDMADGIPQYLKDGNKFSERFPNRAKFYAKMLGE